MNNDETFEFENRVYVNPDISRDEQTAFVDTLRDLQAQKNAQIATETHNLGTDVEPHLGGLSGSEEYWQSKYQTPQVNAMVADMKSVAQQSALNTALQNYQNALQERYNQAYRNYQKRKYKHDTTPVNSGDPDPLNINTNSDKKKTKISQDEGGKKEWLYPVNNYVSDYQDSNGDWWQLSSTNSWENATVGVGLPAKNGQTKTVNGNTYMYIDNGQVDKPTWYRATRSAGPGTYSPYAGS